MFKDKRKVTEKQEATRALEEQLVKLLWPLRVSLKQKLDRRWCRPF